MVGPSSVLFLKRFYGDVFNREFAMGCEGLFKRVPCNGVVDLVERFRLYQGHGCGVYTSVYDYNHNNTIPFRSKDVYRYADNVVLDRIFLDFDKDLTDKAKEAYNDLLSMDSKRDFYRRLILQGQAHDPISEAKKVYNYIVEFFGGVPSLVFSGAKGCHLYIFFKPVKLVNAKLVVSYFVNTVKEKLNLNFLDPAVVGDFGRVSRIPTSYHPKTGFYVHPFRLDYGYGEIISNSKNEKIPFDDFNLNEACSDVSGLLYCIDEYFSKNKEMLRYKNSLKEHMFKSGVKRNVGSVMIKVPEDILLLNQFHCFDRLPYSHDSRMILVLICKWMDLSSEDILKALRIFAENKGYYDPSKHLHDIKQIKALKKYVFSCNTMKKRGLCPYKNKFCDKWFYLKLDLPDEFYKLLKGG